MTSSSQYLETLLADDGKQPLARSILLRELDAAPTTMNYLKYGQAIPGVGKPRKVAILSSFTVETIRPFLDVECYLSRWRCDPVFYQYSMWQPALFELASDGAGGIEAVLLLLDDVTLAEGLGATLEEVKIALEGMLGTFRASSQLPLFLGLAPSRPRDAHKPHRLAEEQGRLVMSQAGNAALAAFAGRSDNVHLVDFAGAMQESGAGWHDPVAFAANLSYLSHAGLRALARCIARSIGPMFAPPLKVLVTDLDDTFWGGIVGEEGTDGVLLGTGGKGRPYHAYQEFLRSLRETGTLLAIASKNNAADADAVFDRRAGELAIGRDMFNVVRIDWNDKAANVIEIADELGLGLDSFVFVDDSPVECERVRQALPMVTVIHAENGALDLPARICATRAFDSIAVSNEDRQRADRYKQERIRTRVKRTAATMKEFLSSLDLTLTLNPFGEANRERAHQLMNKTNQFHLSLERPTPADLAKRMDGQTELYCAALRDRFGEYGIIAVLELEPVDAALKVRNLVISCRALGRQVEDALISFAGRRARDLGLKSIEAPFAAGPRNQQVPDAIRRLGFDKEETTDAGIVFVMPDAASAPPWPECLTCEGLQELESHDA